MYVGSIPATSIYGTWIENVEITSTDDGELADLSSVTEITLRLLDPTTKIWEMVLTKSNGDITVPAPGIIQWVASTGAMSVMFPKLYEVVLIVSMAGVDIPLILGHISIVE